MQHNQINELAVQSQTVATTADLARFALELERIRTQYIDASSALSDARRDEDAARDAHNKAATVAALDRVVANAQAMFDLFDQFAWLAAEIQPLTSTEQKLALLASDATLAPAFRLRVSIPELVLAGVDGTEDALSTLHQLIRWGCDDTAKLCTQKARESRDWLAAEMLAENRGCVVCDTAADWQ